MEHNSNAFWMDPRTWTSLGSAAISFFAFLQTRKFWFEANRPLICARVVTHKSKRNSRTYDLLVANVGNRPATNVRLHIDEQVLAEAIRQDADDAVKKMIYECFADDTVIPLLLAGQEMFNAFGMVGRQDSQNVWTDGAPLPIWITYCNLEGKAYTTRQTLVIRHSEVFGSTAWGRPEEYNL